MNLNNDCKIKWSPEDYAEGAFIAREAEMEMLSRLDFMSITPKVIIDVGSGVGNASLALKERYQDAQVFALDHSKEMVNFIQERKQKSIQPLLADGAHLPFADSSVDLIFANFLLPWQPDFNLFLQEWRRVLRPDGLLAFSALGPDTLQEVKHVVDIAPRLFDMHDFGDALLTNQFAGPVLDVDHITVTYSENQKLMDDLRFAGMILDNAANFLSCERHIPEVTYEIIFAHAFAPAIEAGATHKDGAVSVSLSHLRQMLARPKSM